MRLAEYEAQIAKLELGKCEAFSEDYSTDDLTPREATATDICEELETTIREIRGIAWSPAFETEARELASRANREIDRLCRAHGLLR
jgi:hypothetical protein